MYRTTLNWAHFLLRVVLIANVFSLFFSSQVFAKCLVPVVLEVLEGAVDELADGGPCRPRDPRPSSDLREAFLVDRRLGQGERVDGLVAALDDSRVGGSGLLALSRLVPRLEAAEA